MKPTALIAGATGLIGGHLIKLLLDGDYYANVIAISRRTSGITHDKLTEIITPFDKLDEVQGQLIADDVYICLGSTIKKAGSKEAFYKMDHTYPYTIAQMAQQNGAQQLSIVSALGADHNSSIFYNRVKGELENVIAQLPYQNINIFRPSLLMGDRAETRVGESIGQGFYKALGWAFVGAARKYKGIDATAVAEAMYATASTEQKGVLFYESDAIEAMTTA